MSEVWVQIAQAGIAVLVLAITGWKLWAKLLADQAEFRAELAARDKAHAEERGRWEAMQAEERRHCAEEIARLNREHLEFLQGLIPGPQRSEA